MKKNYKTRALIFLCLVGLAFILHNLGFTGYFSSDYLKYYADTAKGFIATEYAKSVFYFIGLLTLLIAFSVPVGILIPIIGGFLFGWLPGALYANIGATLGATASFLLSRYFIGDYIQERFTSRLERFNKEFKKYGHIYLVGLHFFPITPFFILNILAGATTIGLWTFIWTTAAGVTPAYLIYTYIGHQVTSMHEFSAIVSTKILIAFVVLKILSLATLYIGRFGILNKKV